MRLEVIDDETFVVYLTDFLDSSVLEREESIRLFLKELILKLKRMMKEQFHGYYQLKVYVDAPVMILEFYQIDEYTESVDLNMIIYLHSNIYFCFEEEDLFPGKKYYYQRKFYIPVERISNFLAIIEFGNFIYGEEVEKIRKEGTVYL